MPFMRVSFLVFSPKTPILLQVGFKNHIDVSKVTQLSKKTKWQIFPSCLSQGNIFLIKTEYEKPSGISKITCDQDCQSNKSFTFIYGCLSNCGKAIFFPKLHQQPERILPFQIWHCRQRNKVKTYETEKSLQDKTNLGLQLKSKRLVQVQRKAALGQLDPACRELGL